MDENGEFAVMDEDDEFNLIEVLIRAGADVNAQNIDMQTPLHVAALHHNWEAVDTLTAYNADINIKDLWGDTALHLTVDQLWSRQHEMETGSRIVKKLLHCGAAPNISNNEGETPLMVAAKYGYLDVIKDLLAFGASVHFRNIALETCLHLLFAYSEPDIVILNELLKHGADPNVSNDESETPLMLAVKYGDLDTVKDLLAFGANVHFRNKYSETCLHLLSHSPEPDIAILNELLKHRACVNCCDDNGQTALDVLLELSDKVDFGRKMIKSLIKISTLMNWKHKIVFQVTSQNREKILSLEGFMDGCYKEVSRMKSYIYSNGYTLCHFAINGVKIAKKVKSEIGIMDEVLNTVINDEFPIYDDLIEVHLDKTFLKEKLFEMNVYTRNIKGEVRLHPCVISDIASYLSGRDLLNLARAYTKLSINSLRNGKIN